jgi:hypothetical protein
MAARDWYARWIEGDAQFDGEPAEWTIGDTGVIEFADVDGAPPWEVLADPAHYALPRNVPGPDLAATQESGEPLTGWACTSGPGTPIDVPADFAAPAPSAAGEPANVPAAGSSPGPAPHPPSDGPGDLKPPWTARELDDWLDDVVARGWFRAGPAIDAFYAAREVTFG